MEAFTTHPGPPVTMFTCDTCGETVRQHEGHVCNLSKRQRRRLEESKRREAMAEAQRRAPQPCGDCGRPMTPGRQHACSGKPADKALADALAWQQEGLRRTLLGE